MTLLGIREIIGPLSAATLFFAFLIFIRHVTFATLRQRATVEGSAVDEQMIRLFRAPSILWCLIGGILVGLEVSQIDARYNEPLHTFIHVVLILSITMAAANVAVSVVRNALVRAGSPALNSGIVYGMTQATVWTLGILSILGKLGIAVAPLLTALGVVGLAVGLAFKDTLENAFSGIYLLLDHAIIVGDFVTLEGGQKGTIRDIGWRTSKLEGETGDTLIIPNAKLAQAIVIRRKR